MNVIAGGKSLGKKGYLERKTSRNESGGVFVGKGEEQENREDVGPPSQIVRACWFSGKNGEAEFNRTWGKSRGQTGVKHL